MSRVPNADVAPPTDAGPEAPPAAWRYRRTHLLAAGVALVVGGALTVLARTGIGPLVIGIALTQALLVFAWVLGTGLPGRIGGLVLGLLAAAAADVVVVVWPTSELSPLLAVAGLSVPALFIHQLTRGVVRLRVTESLSDIALLIVSVIAAAALVPLWHETTGVAMATAVLAAATGALVVAHVVDAWWPMPRFDASVPNGLTAVAAAAVVGAVVGFVRLHGTVEFTSARSVFLGAAVGAVASLLGVGCAFLPADVPRPWLRPIYLVLLPLTLVAPVGYLLCLAVRA